MAKKPHLYLRNESLKNDGFKKKRGWEQEVTEEVQEEPKLPNPAQQRRLRIANTLLYQDKKYRIERKTIKGLDNIELIKIYFYKTFNLDLNKKFYTNYGLLVSAYEDFNKTVLFEIVDDKLFSVFTTHVELFFQSEPADTYQGKEYNLIALIHNFKFLTSKRRIKSFSSGLTSCTLITAQNRQAQRSTNAFLAFLQSQEKVIYRSPLIPEYLEIENLSKEEIEHIADNFDIVKAIASSRTERRIPGEFGQEKRDYGFNITVAENTPTVGIIDTGFTKITPLLPALTDINYDLTNNGPYWDENGHGTSVAGLVVLGTDFLINPKESYEANARIAVIKVIQQDNDNINITELGNVIVDAYQRHGIRLFNLSLNDAFHKRYNEAYSDYAYLLDKLSYENDILIFISVGNILPQRLRELIFDEPHPSHEYPTIFYSLDGTSDIHSCETTNIASPSESLNNLSVGAIADNIEDYLNSDITPTEEYPAYYTRKFHYDYEQPINGVEFIRSQRNKHLNKPDLVFGGGDLFSFSAGMEILTPANPSSGPRYFSRGSGTSLSTPLITSLGANVLKEYNILRTQTVKALLINSAQSPCGENIPVFRGFPINLLKKLVGFGRPDINDTIYSNDNSVTFIIESEIELEELQTIKIRLPDYINDNGNKLNFTGTLSYSFLPVRDNHLCYLPLQITFGIFKPIDAETMGQTKTELYRIKPGISWSDDFFGVENRLFSNVQKIDINVSGQKIKELGNEISIGIKCTGKNEIPKTDREHLENTKHKFSIALTITELPSTRADGRLYDEIIAINNIQQIIDTEGEAIAEATA